MDTTVQIKAIKMEEKRLVKLFTGIEEKKRNAINGLIQRAAFMRVSLQEMEADLNANGFTEMFAQGDHPAYMRKRPTADLYNSMNTSYQKIMKQLTDLLPKDDGRTGDGDDFENF